MNLLEGTPSSGPKRDQDDFDMAMAELAACGVQMKSAKVTQEYDDHPIVAAEFVGTSEGLAMFATWIMEKASKCNS